MSPSDRLESSLATGLGALDFVTAVTAIALSFLDYANLATVREGTAALHSDQSADSDQSIPYLLARLSSSFHFREMSALRRWVLGELQPYFHSFGRSEHLPPQQERSTRRNTFPSLRLVRISS